MNSEGKLEAAHNPFTSPLNVEELMSSKTQEELLNVKADAYDIVLNGSEIGGGSIRISDIDIQNRVFEILGLSKEDIESNFG
jgi:aspartyl-tRNA synthetase